MILLDFEAPKWARYCGRRRTTGGAFVDQTPAELRRLDWRHILHQLRYTPWEIDVSLRPDCDNPPHDAA
jgi:hypothetical protein